MSSEILVAPNDAGPITVQWEPDDIDPKAIGRLLAHEVIPQNPDGGTFDAINWTLRSLRRHVYTVSLEECGRVFPDAPTEGEICEWLVMNSEALARYGSFIGWYRHRSEFFLDVSVAVLGRERALNLARQNHQDSIFHSDTGEVIQVWGVGIS